MKDILLLTLFGLGCAGIVVGCEVRPSTEKQTTVRLAKDSSLPLGDTSIAGLSKSKGIAPELVDTSSYFIKLGTCRLHHIPLRVELVPIEYGLRVLSARDQAEMRVDDSLFPHSMTEVSGDCEPRSVRFQRASFCPTCRAARKAWEDRYRADTAATQTKD